MNTLLKITFLLFSLNVFSQSNLFAVFPDSLLENANIIVKEDKTEINISSYNNMLIKKERIITVLNELGLKNIDAYEYFDKSTTIKNLEAIIYNEFGKEIKKFKKKDFIENSVSEGSEITDNRLLYLDFTPTKYPFTIVYHSEVATSNTAFIPVWYSVKNYYSSTIQSTFEVKYNNDVKLKFKEFNFESDIVKTQNPNHLKYSISNVKALRKEDLAPSLQKIVPYVMFGLEKFQLEGLIGNAENWSEFGKWMNDKLLFDTEEIPSKTIIEIQNLIGNESDNLKKAKIIYEYIQNKTRYVSIQLGIGGWKPMLAKNVDRLGYGDCKGLTNYTRSILKAFNIPSYYTIVYGGEEKKDIDEDFVSMQGNHAILGIPNKDSIVWLECTSQTLPFGFQGDFTDDRKVLIIDDMNSKIFKTKSYLNDANFQISKSKIKIANDKDLECDVQILSGGLIFNEKLKLVGGDKVKIKDYYNNFFNILHNKQFSKTDLILDKEKFETEEKISFIAKDFIKFSGNNIIFPLNTINQVNFIPKKINSRKIPFEIDRGYKFEDEISIEIPTNFKLDELPKDVVVESEFGYYAMNLNYQENVLVYKRILIIKKGFYTPEKYEDYRKFREQIARVENSKVLFNLK